MPFSCEDYRDQQQLLVLKKRLSENDAGPGGARGDQTTDPGTGKKTWNVMRK